MTDSERDSRFSLKRWSQRKLEASRAERAPQPERPVVPVAPPSAAAAPASPTPVPPAEPAADPALPPIESLDFDSDFAAFMQPKIAESLRRQALKKLFRDPRFNVMDGLDVYVDDYTIPSPIEPELLREMRHARYVLDPPKTRVNAQGWVEDVPPEEEAPAVAALSTAEMRDPTSAIVASSEAAASAASSPPSDVPPPADDVPGAASKP